MLNTSSYSAPIYTVPAGQPTVNVQFGAHCGGQPDPAMLQNVPIPNNAVPSGGADAEMVIWQPSSDTEWEFFKAAQDQSTGVWSACAVGKIAHVSDNPGIDPPGSGATASGLPLLAYLIRISELQSGHIDHAINLEVPENQAYVFSWPATKTDGKGVNWSDPAEGERFRLDPSLDLSTLPLSPGERIIAKAMQTYGLIVTDSTGSVPAIQAEDPRQYEGSSGVDPYASFFSGSSQQLWLKDIPWGHLQALPWDYGKPGPEALVANRTGGSLTALDSSTGTALTTVPIGNQPTDVAITPDGTTGYVTNSGDGTVTPFDVYSGNAGAPINVGNGPAGVAITPDGKTVYVANRGDGTVTPIDVASGKAQNAIRVGKQPADVAVTPDGKTVYVTNGGDATVTPIDVASGNPGGPIKVGSGPAGLAVTPDGKTVYVANGGDGTVTPVDVASGSAGAPIKVGSGPAGVAVTPDGKTVYVTNGGDDTVTPIDVPSGKAQNAIKVGKQPADVALTPDGKTVYVTNGGDATVTPIDVTSGNARAPINVGSGPAGVAIAPAVNTTTSAKLTASPASVSAAGSVTVSWSGVSNPTSTDWIGIYHPGDRDTAYIDWVYADSCSKTAGTAALSSGSCSVTMPTASGTYELRLYSNDGFTRFAASNQVTVTGGATLSASPATVSAGGSVTVSWNGVSSPTSTDWIGVYHPGDGNSSYIDWIYADSCSKKAGSSATASGSCSFTMPGAAGTYELRLFSNDGYTVLATSNQVSVTGGVTLSASPSSVPTGGTVTVSWNGVTNATTTDWIGLYYPPNTDKLYGGWIYTSSCSQKAGTMGLASGSCSFTMPSVGGNYEFRLFSNDGFTRLATSKQVTAGGTAGAAAKDEGVVTNNGAKHELRVHPTRPPPGAGAKVRVHPTSPHQGAEPRSRAH